LDGKDATINKVPTPGMPQDLTGKINHSVKIIFYISIKPLNKKSIHLRRILAGALACIPAVSPSLIFPSLSMGEGQSLLRAATRGEGEKRALQNFPILR
jgi:hypothetical protein